MRPAHLFGLWFSSLVNYELKPEKMHDTHLSLGKKRDPHWRKEVGKKK